MVARLAVPAEFLQLSQDRLLSSVFGADAFTRENWHSDTSFTPHNSIWSLLTFSRHERNQEKQFASGAFLKAQ